MLGGPGCATGGIFGGIFKTANSRAFRALTQGREVGPCIVGSAGSDLMAPKG